MDLMGPLPDTLCDIRHVLVVADSFTKWVEAFSVPDMLEVMVAEVLVREVVCHFGTFESQVVKELAHLLEVDKTRITPYHPQSSDGQV